MCVGATVNHAFVISVNILKVNICDFPVPWQMLFGSYDNRDILHFVACHFDVFLNPFCLLLLTLISMRRAVIEVVSVSLHVCLWINCFHCRDFDCLRGVARLSSTAGPLSPTNVLLVCHRLTLLGKDGKTKHKKLGDRSRHRGIQQVRAERKRKRECRKGIGGSLIWKQMESERESQHPGQRPRMHQLLL